MQESKTKNATTQALTFNVRAGRTRCANASSSTTMKKIQRAPARQSSSITIVLFVRQRPLYHSGVCLVKCFFNFFMPNEWDKCLLLCEAPPAIVSTYYH